MFSNFIVPKIPISVVLCVLKVLMVDCEDMIFTRSGVKDVLHPQNYDEEHEIMTDYLDINIYLRNKTSIILPYSLSPKHAPIEWMDILEHKVYPAMCGMLEVWQSMIGLNELSLDRLGPGYEFPIEIPSTGVTFEADELCINILDEFMESFLSQLKPVMMAHLADINAHHFECNVNNKFIDLSDLSTKYISNIRKYREAMQPKDSLLSITIKGITSFIGLLSGNVDDETDQDKYGNFYDIDNVFQCMAKLDTSTKLDVNNKELKAAFHSLMGQYMWTTINSLDVMLRNFEIPMTAMNNITMNGAIVIARHDTYPQYMFTDTVQIKHCPSYVL